MTHDSLGDRMKAAENITRMSLPRKIPALLRLDGKSFHTLTGKHCERPYDRRFQFSMWETAKYLCANIQGAQVAYVQSDEISILMTDYQTIQTDAWFDYSVQKMVSVAASMAGAVFGPYFREQKDLAFQNCAPVFDARVWSLPKEEVTNYFLWRQQDATRNSINALAQSKFSHKQLHGKSTDECQEMLFSVHGTNWNDCPTEQKRGVCVRKVYNDFVAKDPRTNTETVTKRSSWEVDLNIPIFSADRQYIENHLNPPQ